MFKIYKYNLYLYREYIGKVSFIDYMNGTHGYSIGKVKNRKLLEEFHNKAKELFPNSENQYIDYLDLLYSHHN